MNFMSAEGTNLSNKQTTKRKKKLNLTTHAGPTTLAGDKSQSCKFDLDSVINGSSTISSKHGLLNEIQRGNVHVRF